MDTPKGKAVKAPGDGFPVFVKAEVGRADTPADAMMHIVNDVYRDGATGPGPNTYTFTHDGLAFTVTVESGLNL